MDTLEHSVIVEWLENSDNDDTRAIRAATLTWIRELEARVAELEIQLRDEKQICAQLEAEKARD